MSTLRIHESDENSMTIFATKQLIEEVQENCTIYVDATFKILRFKYTQLLAVLASINQRCEVVRLDHQKPNQQKELFIISGHCYET
ncbi:CLUMA_CG004988, isoform A [Clunio marinus]|uniref:CLUMA_CG004988, isoform A n=1 Tax=Clunio marinus TaxID=568069 RepID=A0A1J1HUU5_9DIPT|nr:CLUMA_CG004988, isoform A [Clunio marinus]